MTGSESLRPSIGSARSLGRDTDKDRHPLHNPQAHLLQPTTPPVLHPASAAESPARYPDTPPPAPSGVRPVREATPPLTAPGRPFLTLHTPHI